MYYHLSRKKLYNGNFLTPKIPTNMREEELDLSPRICFSNSIDGCLMAGISKGVGRSMYVYTPVDYAEIYKPKVYEVRDCKITGEVWIQKRIPVKFLGRIIPTKFKGRKTFHTYKGNIDVHMYEWKWVEKVKED